MYIAVQDWLLSWATHETTEDWVMSQTELYATAHDHVPWLGAKWPDDVSWMGEADGRFLTKHLTSSF